MCTVTWRREPNGYELFFNRDERKTRAEAEAPERRESGGVGWLAPVDADFGGTWLAVNQYGLAVGLLNGYHRADLDESRAYRSRGLLVADLAPTATLPALTAQLTTLDLESYRTFRLLALAPDAPALLAEWDGERLVFDEDAEDRRPVISSSFEETDVGQARRSEYEKIVGSSEPTHARLHEYHRSTTNGPSAYSVSMERPEACTRSLTRVIVTPDDSTMIYRPGRPDLDAQETPLSLRRESVRSAAPRSPGPS